MNDMKVESIHVCPFCLTIAYEFDDYADKVFIQDENVFWEWFESHKLYCKHTIIKIEKIDD